MLTANDVYRKSDIKVSITPLAIWGAFTMLYGEAYRRSLYAEEYSAPTSFGDAHAIRICCPDEEKYEIIPMPFKDKQDAIATGRGHIRHLDETAEPRAICKSDYTQLNELCKTSYIQKLFRTFPGHYNASLITIGPGFIYPTHIDEPKGKSYRCHVALDTGPRCGLAIEGHVFSIPVDGRVWFMKAGEYEHLAWNLSDKSRTHLTWQMPLDTYEEQVNRNDGIYSEWD
jgi:hypothetical protein